MMILREAMSNITHPHDTALPVGDATHKVLEQVDQVIATAIEEQDPMVIVNYGLNLRMASQVSGLGLAKLLYEGRENWNAFRSDDDFATVAKTQMGVADQTYNKYIWVWEHVVRNDYLLRNPDIQMEILGKPIGGLILLTAAARENQLTPGDWKDIRNAPDVRSIRDIVARVRGHIGPAKYTLRLWLRNDGTMYGKIGGEEYGVVGFIHRDGTKLSEAVEARLESAGVVIEARE
jgi:hypothetical protein